MENCLKEEEGVRGEVAVGLDRAARTRGARRLCDWRTGTRMFLLAVRRLRLIDDMMILSIQLSREESF